MSAPLDGIESYSAFVYAVADRHSFVTHSALTLAPIGATLAKLEGRIECQGGIHLEVWELIDFVAHRIRTYSYEIYRAGEKVCWYDAWEHPEIPALAPTFSHHKHVPPNLRDNRMAALASVLNRRTWTQFWRTSGRIGFSRIDAFGQVSISFAKWAEH